jgi:hypothetical protein
MDGGLPKAEELPQNMLAIKVKTKCTGVGSLKTL